MRFNIHRIIAQTKSTQILYGFVGCVYGASKVIEYYPEKAYNIMVEENNLFIKDAKDRVVKYTKEISEYKKIIEDSDEEIKKRQSYSLFKFLFSFGEIFALALESALKEFKITENENLIKIIENKEYIQLSQIKKPLFLIENNSLSTNIAMSSVFYGTIFAFAGTVPIVSFTLLSSYVIYKHN
jgi:hypothetical protein